MKETFFFSFFVFCSPWDRRVGTPILGDDVAVQVLVGNLHRVDPSINTTGHALGYAVGQAGQAIAVPIVVVAVVCAEPGGTGSRHDVSLSTRNLDWKPHFQKNYIPDYL